MPIYNKLVRDKILEVIKRSGKEFHTRILSDDEYKQELQKKLQEEPYPFQEALDKFMHNFTDSTYNVM